MISWFFKKYTYTCTCIWFLKCLKSMMNIYKFCFTKSSFFCHFGVGIKYVMRYLRKKCLLLKINWEYTINITNETIDNITKGSGGHMLGCYQTGHPFILKRLFYLWPNRQSPDHVVITQDTSEGHKHCDIIG